MNKLFLDRLITAKNSERKVIKKIKLQGRNKVEKIEFLKAIEKYAMTERGDKVRINSWHKEYSQLISNLQIAETLTTGCAQNSKTLFHTFLACYLLTQGFNILWAYDQERTLNRNVPIQFRPIIEQWELEANLKGNRKKASNSLYQLGKSAAIFTFTSTSKQNKSGKVKGASAGSAVVSVSVDILFLEERSQYEPGSDAPLYRRLDAGKIPTHPVRQLGTPGNGQGIEKEIKKADYYFYPHCICKYCKEEIKLDPRGTLLKSRDRLLPNNEIKKSFYSDSGRPQEWHFKNKKNAIKSAYFACPECKKEIDKTSRTKKSYFKCIKKNIKLTDFLKQKINPEERLKVAINLSPLLRDSTYNLASDIIRSGLDSSNPDDWQQQRLGLQSETNVNSVSEEMILACIGEEIPVGKPDLIIAGVDQGRSEYWLTIAEIYFPDNYYSEYEKIDKSIRVIKFAGGVIKSELLDRLEAFEVEFGVIDNEPDIESASRICDTTGTFVLADQRSQQLEEYKKGKVKDGGIEYECYLLRNEKFLKQVLINFSSLAKDNKPIYRLPDYWDTWINKPSERSPLVHLTNPSYDPDTGKWNRTEDHTDDLYYSFAFVEAALTLEVTRIVSMWGNL